VVSERRSTIADGFARGTSLLRSGLCDEALTEFRAVYAEAEADGDPASMAAALCEMAWSSYKLGEIEQALECAMGAKWLWLRLGDRAELSRAMAVEAIAFLDLGFSDQAYDLSAEALVIAETLEDPAILAFALNAKGIVLTVCREIELGAGLLERASDLADTQGNDAAAAYYLVNRGFCHAKLAERAAALNDPETASAERKTAIGFTEHAIELAERCDDAWTQRVGFGNCAEMLALEGRFAAALGYLGRSAELPGDPGPSLRIHYLYTLGDVLLRAGNLEAAHTAAIEALALADATGQIDHQVNAVSKLAEILEALGQSREALALQKRFHQLYVRQSGEIARRLARVEEIRAETDRLRSRAAILADQALSDPLTGIANRRSFDQIVNRLAGTPFAIAIVDLDNFKLVNDRFSHIVGDAVLQRVATTMVSQLGPHGHAARLGGEEFALIFPGAAETTATAFCEGVRIAVSATNWSDLGAGLAVTVSIGVVAGEGEQPVGELMHIADRRLYAAKAGGRDCVVCADEPVIVLADAADRRRWRA
jgi:diguanylate cyclase